MSHRSGEVVEVLHRRRVDVCCVQESRWKGGSARMLGAIGRRYKFFWQGCNEGTDGVGVLIAEKWIDQVLSISRVNERIIFVKLIVGKRLTNVISIYAPQVGRSQDEKDAFWDKAIMVLSGIPQNEVIILGGDLNGHVGRESDGFEGVHGGQGYGMRNAEGERILEFGDALELVLCNTLFKKDEAKLVTCSSGGYKSTIDYIMVRKEDHILVRDAKAIPGEECVSQHRLVIGDLTLRIKKVGAKKQPPKLKVWKLHSAGSKNEFREKIEHIAEEVEEMMESGGVDGKWQAMKKALLEATEEVCGWSKGKARQRETWW
nr:craniofacial development protein 2-like [Syngnathus scovelli]XP_049587336.1 craniofacial development protein 2-like [Syngnathus scovelli]XP_049587343.1 craniofacial development protein 2-like [Syngnathus scovelli]XP_049587352.1 craniofacial development protein 2-like [Syngnathus scovelli]XP_049587362.1 craniofacial development protein 2-like [Syngnathus scovelli]